MNGKEMNISTRKFASERMYPNNINWNFHKYYQNEIILITVRAMHSFIPFANRSV